MLPKEFYQACKKHNWEWRLSTDDSVLAEGYANEAKLKALAFESPTLNEIWVRFRYDEKLRELEGVRK